MFTDRHALLQKYGYLFGLPFKVLKGNVCGLNNTEEGGSPKGQKPSLLCHVSQREPDTRTIFKMLQETEKKLLKNERL